MKKQLKLSPLTKEFDKFIRGSVTGKRRKPDGMRISSGTIETYKNCRKVFAEYSAKYPEPSLYMGVTVNKKIARERILYWQRTLHSFTDYLRKCNYSDNYIWNTLKILRTFLRYLNQEFGLPDPGFAKVRLPRIIHPDPLTLTVEQVQHLVRANFNNTSYQSRFEFIRDIVVTSCITALRYSDLMALTWDQLIFKDEKCWINIQSQKTGITSKMLIPEYLLQLLQKYKCSERKSIFPKLSNVNLNIQIKNLGKFLGWNEDVVVLKSKMGTK